MRQFVLAAAMVGALAASARADVVQVPGDHPTIQAGVNAAGNGDKLIIAAGTYNENVTVDGKTNLLIRGRGLVTVNGGAGNAFIVTNSTDVRVKGLSFVSTTAFGAGAGTSSNVQFSKCRSQGVIGFAFVNADGSSVVACKLTGTTTGIAFAGTGTLTAERCKVTSPAGGRAIVAGGENVNLIRCKVTYTGVPTMSPIELTHTVAALVERCRVQVAPSGPNVAAIEMTPGAGAATIELVRNRLEGCSYGIAGYSGAVNNVTAFGNIITGAALGGIGINGVSLQIERNKVLLGNPGAFGILCINATNTTVIRNKVQNAGTGVLVIGDGNDITLNKLKNLTFGVSVAGNANTIGPDNKYKNCATPYNDGGTNTVILDP